jgi:hypothetical protein
VKVSPQFDGNEFAGWRLADQTLPADAQVVTIKLVQNEKDTGMTADISASKGPSLKLSLGMEVLEGPDYPVRTSSCPLMSNGGLRTFESWSDPIYTLMVGVAKRLGDKYPMVCD